MTKQILCKSALTIDQLKHRMDLNCDGIELQLLEDFINNPLTTTEYVNILAPYIQKIKAIHTPLKSGEEFVELQVLDITEKRDYLARVCKLADNISNKNKECILIIIHNRWSLEDFKAHPNTYKEALACLNNLLELYPNVRIGIENVIPFIPGKQGFSNGCQPDYTKVIKDIRKELDTDRIGSVIDTCHMFITKRFLDNIDKQEGTNYSFTVEDFFKANKGISLLIHLCNVEGYGYTAETHGTPFTKESKYILDELLKLHSTYTQDSIITIETIESDYTNCLNYKATRDLIA